MSRFLRRESLMTRTLDDNDEEKLYERQALIDDQELCDDDVNLLSNIPYAMRQRQSAKPKISNNYNSDGHELTNLGSFSTSRDFISEPTVEFTYYDIQPNDTLQSICLRYACPVNQVKRINGLISDQDFYGLSRIKLPLGKLGLLQDILNANQQKSLNSSSSQQSRSINYPGSALSISNVRNSPFKPLLTPGYSRDRLDNIARETALNNQYSGTNYNNGSRMYPTHSHSFSSLREFTLGSDAETNQVDLNFNHPIQCLDSKSLKQNFIKEDNHYFVKDLMTDTEQIDNVFQDLDFHVERAKAAAETYDQRAAELVDKIDVIGAQPIRLSAQKSKVSKIPELFHCNENFGLSYKKLIVLIFIVCLFVPLVDYISQSNVVTTRLN